jgi:hypothetical protein
VSGRPTGPIIDVDRLVSDLQERVAARTAAGEYDDGLLRTPFSLFSDTPVGTIVLRPDAAYSSKPVIGPVITRIKRALIASLFHFLNDAVSQANVALASSRRALDAETSAREALEAQMMDTERQLTEALDRITTLEESFKEQRTITERVDLSHTEARLARLERSTRPSAPADATLTRPVDPQLAALAARLNEPEEADERYDAYIAQIGAGPIIDLAPGVGALLARCAEAGIKATGVGEMDDPLTHLGSLAPSSVHGIVAIGLCDRLGIAGIATLADLAATRLTTDGTLVVEVTNPLTLAGRTRRLRDPTLAAPVHPDTIAWTFRLAGLHAVEIRHLGAFPQGEGLPLEVPAKDELDERYNTIAYRVNRALVGQPLVAIIARRTPAA